MDKNLPAIIFKSNDKINNYINKLDNAENKNITDVALYTPINSIQRLLVRYEIMKLITNIQEILKNLWELFLISQKHIGMIF